MVSPIQVTKKLVETKLKQAYPTTVIAFENVSTTHPADGALYLRCSMQVRTPDDSCIGGNYYREDITFFIYVLDKLNIGTGNALSVAEDIRTLFKKRTVLQEGNVRVHVLTTPRIAGAVVTNDRLVIPLSIELTIENL